MFQGRKPKPAPPAVLPGWLKNYLLTGSRPPRGTPDGDAYKRLFLGGPDAIRAAWEANREQLVAESIELRPGSRPWAWWIHDYTDDFDDQPYLNREESQAHYRARLEVSERESEASTLKRRGLLAPGELERIPAKAFLPVEPEPDPREVLRDDAPRVH